nr:hypothetical protein CFP56_46748 [Quercus suber]
MKGLTDGRVVSQHLVHSHSPSAGLEKEGCVRGCRNGNDGVGLAPAGARNPSGRRRSRSVGHTVSLLLSCCRAAGLMAPHLGHTLCRVGDRPLAPGGFQQAHLGTTRDHLNSGHGDARRSGFDIMPPAGFSLHPSHDTTVAVGIPPEMCVLQGLALCFSPSSVWGHTVQWVDMYRMYWRCCSLVLRTPGRDVSGIRTHRCAQLSDPPCEAAVASWVADVWRWSARQYLLYCARGPFALQPQTLSSQPRRRRQYVSKVLCILYINWLGAIPHLANLCLHRTWLHPLDTPARRAVRTGQLAGRSILRLASLSKYDVHTTLYIPHIVSALAHVSPPIRHAALCCAVPASLACHPCPPSLSPTPFKSRLRSTTTARPTSSPI